METREMRELTLGELEDVSGGFLGFMPLLKKIMDEILRRTSD